jgi:hypothetical protein
VACSGFKSVSELTISATDWGGQSCVWDMILTVTEAGIRTEIQPNHDLGAVIIAGRVKVVEVRPVDAGSAA